MQSIKEIMEAAIPNLTSSTPLTEPMCKECNDMGQIIWLDEKGRLFSRMCDCQRIKNTENRIAASGLAPLMEAHTFDNYQPNNSWQANVKKTAAAFVQQSKNEWLFICGRPGTGKTHICTAIVGELIKKGKDVRYMVWRETAPRLKALVLDRNEYEAEIDKYKSCSVLYIDDFFKGGKITEADVNLAFEILNYRYNANKQTIISGEKDLQEIIGIDEAVGSRIYQRAKNYLLHTGSENWRMR